MKQQQLLLFILREKCPVVSLTRGEIDIDRLRSERNSFFWIDTQLIPFLVKLQPGISENYTSHKEFIRMNWSKI